MDDNFDSQHQQNQRNVLHRMRKRATVWNNQVLTLSSHVLFILSDPKHTHTQTNRGRRASTAASTPARAHTYIGRLGVYRRVNSSTRTPHTQTHARISRRVSIAASDPIHTHTYTHLCDIFEILFSESSHGPRGVSRCLSVALIAAAAAAAVFASLALIAAAAAAAVAAAFQLARVFRRGDVDASTLSG